MISLARYAQRVVDGAAPAWTLPPASHRLTSMCLEIAPFGHADCPGEWCACKCHEGAS